MVEVVDGKLTVSGKGTYQCRTWLRAQGASYLYDTKRWVFPSDCVVTAKQVEAKVTEAALQRKVEVHRKRLQSLEKARRLKAQRTAELKDPAKKLERERNYENFIKEGGVDWKTGGPDSRCGHCKGLMWSRPFAPCHLMECPLCGRGES